MLCYVKITLFYTEQTENRIEWHDIVQVNVKFKM